MKRPMILYMMIIVLCSAGGIAQSSGEQPDSTRGSSRVADIRKVDFLNFTYHSSLCSQEYEKGIGKTVTVHNGEFKNRNVYFAVEEKLIAFADLTGDVREEAIVPVDCGAINANFSRSEINIYTIQDGSATLLAQIHDKDLERDYRAQYADAESYWGINDNGIKTNNGNLTIDVLADGSHAAPKHIVALEYHLRGKSLVLVGKPQRKNLEQ